MANFVSIPNELIDEILSYVDHKDLFNASQLCKTIGYRAVPMLYHKISWKLRGQNKTAMNEPPVHLLLRRIVQEPRLAEYIIDFELDIDTHSHKPSDYKYHDEFYKPGPAKFKRQDRAWVHRVLAESGLPEGKLWRRALANDTMEAIVGLLLTRLRRVKRIAFGPCLQSQDGFLSMAVKHILNTAPSASQSSFGNLEQVKLTATVSRYPGPSTDKLPAVESAEWHMSDTSRSPDDRSVVSERQWPSMDWLDDLPRRGERLRSLRLIRTYHHAPMHGWEEASILQATSNLSTLEYHFMGKHSLKLNCTMLGQALDHVQDTLKKLTVTYDQPHWASWYEYGPSTLTGSLAQSIKSLRGLEELETSLMILLGSRVDGSAKLADIFPERLRMVCFVQGQESANWTEWGRDEIWKKILEFFNNRSWSNATPMLQRADSRLFSTSRKSRYWRTNAVKIWRQSDQKAFKRLVEGQGLRCEISTAI